MEGGCDGGDGAGGRRRMKKTIRRRQADEGSSTAAHEDPPVAPMEEDVAAEVPNEDVPVGPKKSELRSRLGWAAVRAIYHGLPDFQRARLEEMGFGPFLRLDELAPDVALIQALKERRPAVTGVTYTSYQELAERLLGLAVTRERSSLILRTGLQASLGVASARHETGESQADYMTRMTEDARAALAEEEGVAADRYLRRFLILVIGKLILGTRGDPALGLHQSVVEFPTRQRPWERPSRSFRGIQQETDWTVRVRKQLTDWDQRGREVVSEATSDEDYFSAYTRRYGAQVYKGSRRPLDPVERISSLEGILHSTIQQRDDLQAVVDQLRAELDRAQQMVGGASSSREDPGHSVLEGQLASAAARAEDALSQLREREQELRTALARTTTLEAEMADLRLRPKAAEVTR
ncbi:hypothetical protein Taro_029974 [Colocasia esculenta]|uniref:Uncharacterized protein n=1 Tax=Colocasia esculenta TaxID=4460 RepID=A0A843W1X5_COLES|nr:hypothetical protein [Colocasia esculenta]